MKNTLEYKLLSFLKNQKDGLFRDVVELSENETLLKDTITDLKDRDFIGIEKYPSESSVNSNFLSISDSKKPPKCKIKSKGIEYVEKIDNDTISIEKSKIEVDLAKSNIKANKLNSKIAKQNKKNEKFNNISTIINIIIGILNVALIAWQILKD